MKKYLLITIIMLPAFLQAQKNSQWRGENRDGIYNETGLLKQWAEEGPQMLWKYEGLGAGHTSVAIANDKLYITGLIEDKVVLHIFDLKGKLLTKKEIAKEWNESYNGPRSTICVNDGRLYVYTGYGELICIDEQSLNQIWSKQMFSDFDGKNIVWGVCESPLIIGDKIIATPGGEKNNIVALNKKTGELIWSSPGEGKVTAYCSPQYIGDQSIPIVVTSTSDFIIGLNADTGEKLWSYPQTNRHNIHPNTPMYNDGFIFSATGYGQGAVMLRLTNGGKSIEEVWKQPLVDTQLGGSMKVGNYIYSSGHNNRFWFCVDWTTGEIKYQTRELAPCNVIFADGMLYCYSEKGEISLVKPDPTKPDIISAFKVTLGTEQHWAHNVIHNGVLYVRHGDALMAYNVKM